MNGHEKGCLALADRFQCNNWPQKTPKKYNSLETILTFLRENNPIMTGAVDNP